MTSSRVLLRPRTRHEMGRSRMRQCPESEIPTMCSKLSLSRCQPIAAPFGYSVMSASATRAYGMSSHFAIFRAGPWSGGGRGGPGTSLCSLKSYPQPNPITRRFAVYSPSRPCSSGRSAIHATISLSSSSVRKPGRYTNPFGSDAPVSKRLVCAAVAISMSV